MLAIPDKIKILYIEDDEPSSFLTLKYLKEATISEFVVVHMCTLAEGLKYIKTHCRIEQDCETDVILIDLILPDAKGIDTYKQLVDSCSFLPIVIISEHSDMATACVRLGAQDYLFKPDYNGGTLTRSLTYAVQRDYLRKQFERERDISKMYLDIAGVILLVIDVDHNVSMINKKGCEVLGYTEKEIIGKNWFDNFIPEDIRNEIRHVFGQVISEQLDFSEFYSNPIMTKNGDLKWIAWHNSLIRDNSKSITGVLSSGEDISEIVTAQDLLKQTVSQYKNLIEVYGASVFGLDFINERFTYVNDVMVELMGYSREELLKMGPQDFLTPRSKEVWYERIESLKNGDAIDNVEYECLKKNGEKVWVLVTTNYPDVNQTNGGEGVAINITATKVAERIIKEREVAAYKLLENKILAWKEEIQIQIAEREVIENKLASFFKGEVEVEI